MIGGLASLNGGGAAPAVALLADVAFVGYVGVTSAATIGVHASSLAGDFTRFHAHTTVATLTPPTTPPLSGVETIDVINRHVVAGGKFISGPADTCVFGGTPAKADAATYRNVISGITHKGSLSGASGSTITLPAILDAAPGSMYQLDISFNQQDAAIDTAAFPTFTGHDAQVSGSALWRHYRMPLPAGGFAGGNINFTVGGVPHADIYTATWVVMR